MPECVTASWNIVRSWQTFVLIIILYFKWQTEVVREYFTPQLQGCQR